MLENRNTLSWVRFGEHACVWVRPYTNTQRLVRAETFERNTIYAARPVRSQPHKVTVVFGTGSQSLRVPLAVPYEHYRVRFVVTETYMVGEPARSTSAYCEHVRLAMVRMTCQDTSRIRDPERHAAPYWSFPIASWYVIGNDPQRLPDPGAASLRATR